MLKHTKASLIDLWSGAFEPKRKSFAANCSHHLRGTVVDAKQMTGLQGQFPNLKGECSHSLTHSLSSLLMTFDDQEFVKEMPRNVFAILLEVTSHHNRL